LALFLRFEIPCSIFDICSEHPIEAIMLKDSHGVMGFDHGSGIARRWTGYISWHFRHVASLLFASRFGPVEAEWGAWHVMQLSSGLSAVAATQTGCSAVGCPNLPFTRFSIVSFLNESGCKVTFPPKSGNGCLLRAKIIPLVPWHARQRSVMGA
jgi:hypothetical protein